MGCGPLPHRGRAAMVATLWPYGNGLTWQPGRVLRTVAVQQRRYIYKYTSEVVNTANTV